MIDLFFATSNKLVTYFKESKYQVMQNNFFSLPKRSEYFRCETTFNF